MEPAFRKSPASVKKRKKDFYYYHIMDQFIMWNVF